MPRAFIYSKVPVDVPLTYLTKSWPRETATALQRYQDAFSTDSVTCVSMMAHPMSADGHVDTRKIIEIMCVGPGYTVYVKAGEDKCGRQLGQTWRTAATDSFNLKSNTYSTIRARPLIFTTEKNAHSAVSGALGRYYSNSHCLIDEFVYKTALMSCATEGCKGMSNKLFGDNKVPLCRECIPDRREEGITVATPNVIELDELPSKLWDEERWFTKPGMVDIEYVTFDIPEKLPFVKGEDIPNDFAEMAKSVVFDIETVTVDESLCKPIADEIVSIMVSRVVGKQMTKLALFSRRLPEGWNESMEIDTNVLLADQLNNDKVEPLPPLAVFKCVNEASLLASFIAFLKTVRPHFLVHFNGHNFDIKFLLRASVVAGMQPLTQTLDHLINVRRFNNNPMRDIDQSRFIPPFGDLCKGLISSKVMSIEYDTFPCLISIDLLSVNNSSLNDACYNKQVLGCKLKGVAHTDIPRLYYGRHPDFTKYAIMDIVVTTKLYFKDMFDVVELFMVLENLVSTPWNLSVSQRRSIPAVTTNYVQFQSYGFLTEAVLRPKRLLANAVVDGLIDFFFGSGKYPKIDNALQLVVDFINGHCKCNTMFRAWHIDSTTPVTASVVFECIRTQLRRRKKTDPPYSTVELIILLFYLSEGAIDWTPFDSVIKMYGKELEKAAKKTTKASVLAAEKKMSRLKNYLRYLVTVRRCLSMYEDPKLLWKNYAEHHKTDLCVTGLKEFADAHHREILKAARASHMYPRRVDVAPMEIAKIIKEAIGAPIELRMLSYDGAHIVPPVTGVNLDWPVAVFDFASQYPSSMLAINLGLETHASADQVFTLLDEFIRDHGMTLDEAVNLMEKNYVHVCPTRRIDDTLSWKDYLQAGERLYVTINYVFFVKQVTSVQNHQFAEEIKSRLQDKKKSGDPNLTSEERKAYANISQAKKININSRYGVISKTGKPGFQPTVTGKGRRSIKETIAHFGQMYNYTAFYGDSIPGYTPVTLRDSVSGEVFIRTFDTLEGHWVPYEQFKDADEDRWNKEQLNNPGLEVMTDCGWQRVLRFVRHKTVKKVYRVLTHAGLVDVTEDHSLLDEEKNPIKPTEVKIGMTKLLQVEKDEMYFKGDTNPMSCNLTYQMGVNVQIPLEILSSTDSKLLESFIEGLCPTESIETNNQASAQAFFILLKRLGYKVTIDDSTAGVYTLTWTRKVQHSNVVKEVKLLHAAYTDPVYDVETMQGTFNAGIGDIVLKNTDSCCVALSDFTAQDLWNMSCSEMHAALKFPCPLEEFDKEIYSSIYLTKDKRERHECIPAKVRSCAGQVVHALCERLAPMLSTDTLKLEAEKTLLPFVLPAMKKYTAHNCVTGKTLTKGLSVNNKSSFPITKEILVRFNTLCLECKDHYDLICSLYHYLATEVTAPIEMGTVELSKLAKPLSVHLQKVKQGSKHDTLIKRMRKEGVNFLFESAKLKVVSTRPEDGDKGWSFCDILTQSCEGKIHTIKTKMDVLKEILNIIAVTYGHAVTAIVERLIMCDYNADYTAETFKELDRGERRHDGKRKYTAYRPMSYAQIDNEMTRGKKRRVIRKLAAPEASSDEDDGEACGSECEDN